MRASRLRESPSHAYSGQAKELGMVSIRPTKSTLSPDCFKRRAISKATRPPNE
jgi:hypothetical protein